MKHSIFQHTHTHDNFYVHTYQNISLYKHQMLLGSRWNWESSAKAKPSKPKLRYGTHSRGTNIALCRHLATFFRHRASCGIAPQASVLRAIMKGAFWMDVNHHLEAAKRIVHTIKVTSNKKNTKICWVDLLIDLIESSIVPIGLLYNMIYADICI